MGYVSAFLLPFNLRARRADRDIALKKAKSPLKRSQSTRPPPAPSSGAAGVVPTSDLSRYVSSSTGPPPSTFGISTVSSYTKHVGPPVGRSTGSTATKLTNIPYEPSSEPLRVGKLEFDRERSKWVRARPGGHARVGSFGSSGRRGGPIAALHARCE
jgi:hypothetical protein